MHEIGIAEDLAKIVLEEAAKHRLSIVSKVSVCIGEMIQIVPAIFEVAFREAVRETIADSSILGVEIVKVKIRCRNCGGEIKSEGNELRCPDCGSETFDIVNGKELFVESIEGE